MAIIRLTTKLFKKLDYIARLEGGRPIKIVDYREMKNNFAQVSMMAGSVYLNANKTEGRGICTDCNLIELANQINTEKFYNAERPEIDWGRIPENKIYKYLVLHEIGHVKLDYCRIQAWEKLNGDKEKYRLFQIGSELRADRYAWRKLFPNKPIPVKINPAREELYLTTMMFMWWQSQYFPEERTSCKTIPLDSKMYVPTSHIKNGIPWAVSKRTDKKKVVSFIKKVA